MDTQTLNLYEILKRTISEPGAKAIVTYLHENIEAIVVNKMENKMENLATKQDLLKVETTLEKRISETKADLMKWMFLFVTGQTALLVGLIKFIH